MHKASFDDTLSGTTAVTAWLRGNRLHIANVGDSRAILGVGRRGGPLKAVALSLDQTPYRLDERNRCKAYGARIMNMGQVRPARLCALLIGLARANAAIQSLPWSAHWLSRG